MEQLDFMKLDVEGYETLVILGAINTIKKFKPIIALECWSNHQGSIDIKYTTEKFDFLLKLGYSVTQIAPGCPDFLFLPL